jgi:hypothetical protein
MVSALGVRSEKGAISPLLEADIGLTFAEEANWYVPSTFFRQLKPMACAHRPEQAN